MLIAGFKLFLMVNVFTYILEEKTMVRENITKIIILREFYRLHGFIE